ncbi:oxygenase MpaB family protein [Kiritimatiellaeota bacterium B1221]|nr:oxygenase MpaB family protein [Kiritimatiellaeota bacterium B1221]
MNTQYGSDFTRKLWTDLDHILLVYVGSAAEFALVEENHWLFYTNKLPSAPLERLISTFAWNQKVMMTSSRDAETLAKTIRGFHDQVESERAREEGGHPQISNAAFRAVGAMLIEYAIRAEAYLEQREVNAVEKENYYFDQVGFFKAMGIDGWEESYQLFHENHAEELVSQLKVNTYTVEMFQSYRKDLGALRYSLLVQFMAWFVPESVREELKLKKSAWFKPLFYFYPKLHGWGLSKIVHRTLLPPSVLKGLRTK